MNRSTSPVQRLAVLVLVPLMVLVVTPAGADEIDDKRAEAERLARELQADGERLSMLAEEFNAARLEAAEVEARAAAAEAELSRLDRKLDSARAAVRLQAVEAYVRGGSFPAPEVRDDSLDPSRLEQYVSAILGRQQDAIDSLHAAMDDVSAQRVELDRTRASARAALSEVDQARRQAASADAARRATLSQVRGELTALVEAETRRQAEAEARQVEEQAAAVARQPASRTPSATAAPARRSGGDSPTTTATPKKPSPVREEPAGPAPPPASGASAAVEEAKRQLGKPYEWGGSGPDTFDCSGLTAWAWKAGGKYLPHSSKAQYSATTRVALADIAPGDLLFFGNPIHHVGLYVGGGQMIEAPQTGSHVRYRSIHRSDMVGIGRVN